MPNGGLVTASVSLQQVCGYFLVTEVVRPADTPTNTTDRSLTLVGNVPTVTWTSRAKTQAEIDAATVDTNRSAIITNLTSDMAAIQGIIDATNASINSNPAAAIKTICRMLRRLGRNDLNDFTGST